MKDDDEIQNNNASRTIIICNSVEHYSIISRPERGSDERIKTMLWRNVKICTGSRNLCLHHSELSAIRSSHLMKNSLSLDSVIGEQSTMAGKIMMRRHD